MTKIYEALEFCLREIEEGASIEAALRRFPEFADELRPILETSIQARRMASPEPVPETTLRVRAKIMRRVTEMNRAKSVAPRRVIPFFQRLVIAFTLAALFLLSGNGLLSASASALPGERLYPVKRGWENLRLFLIFDTEARSLLEDEFENERLHEVNELLSQGRNEMIEFAGVFMRVNGMDYISGLQVTLSPATQVPENGAPVMVSGRTTPQGIVEIITLQILPAGYSVPVGNPIVVEPQPAALTPQPGPQISEMWGTLQAISPNSLVVSGMTVYLDNPKIEGTLCVGAEVELEGYYDNAGRFIVKEAKALSGCIVQASPMPGLSGNTNNTDRNNNEDNNNKNSNDDDSNDDDSNDND